MLIISFKDVALGSSVARLSAQLEPVYVKINNNYKHDEASGMPEGNVAPYAGFNADETCLLLTKEEASIWQKCFDLYQLGYSLRDKAHLKDGTVWLKANILQLDQIPGANVFKW